MARLLWVNVGLPRDIQWNGRSVHTAVWKDPVHGRCRVGRLNLDGDAQATWLGTAAKIELSSHIRSNRIVTGRNT